MIHTIPINSIYLARSLNISRDIGFYLEGQGGQGQAPAEVKPQKDDAHCIETETLCRQAKAIAERCVKLCYAAEINRTVKYGLDMKESYPLVI